MSDQGIIYRRDRVNVDGSLAKEKVHSYGGDVPDMVIMMVGEQDCLNFLLRLKRQAGGKGTGIYSQDIVNQQADEL